MKKFISAILCAALFSSLSAFAAPEEPRLEEILASVKERVGGTDSFGEFSSDSFSNKFGTQYSFYWSDNEDGNWRDMSVTCNSDGVITSYSLYNSSHDSVDKPTINRPTRATALSAAQEALDRLNPGQKGRLKVTDSELYESFSNDKYSFTLTRFENGIPVTSDTGRIVLNSDLELTRFNMSYTTGLDFVMADGAISEEEATAAFCEKIGTRLYYDKVYNTDGTSSLRLIYDPSSELYIDARSSEPISVTSYYDAMSEDAVSDAATSGGGSSSNKESFSEAEQKELEAVAGLMSAAEADAAVKKHAFFNIPKGQEAASSSLFYVKSADSYRYRLTYRPSGYVIYITVDAKSGEVISFNRMKSSAGSESVKSNTATAGEIISALAPEKAAEYKIAEDSTENSVFYTRYVNGIEFPENTIHIAFFEDKSPSSYYISYDDLDFPSPDGIISAEEAFSLVKNHSEYRLCYVSDYESEKIIPVYALSSQVLIDAFTGTAVYGSSPERGGEYSDLNGHFAEDKIKTLAKYGIFFDGTEFKPDEPITQRDYAALLAVVFFCNDAELLRGGETVKTVYSALPFGLFDSSCAEQTLTRLEAAELMVQAMGAEEYAKLSGIYSPLYNDVTDGLGYVNILTGMGVISGDGAGSFRPAKMLTRAEAAVMIYNYLAR